MTWRFNTLAEQQQLIEWRRQGVQLEYRSRSQAEQWYTMINEMQFNFQGCQYRREVKRQTGWLYDDPEEGLVIEDEERPENLGKVIVHADGTSQFFINRNRM